VSKEAELKRILLADDWFAAILETVRDVSPPQWVVGAGVIRTLVWDHLHGYEQRTTLQDVDVAFFDPSRLEPARDREVELALCERLPGVPFEATNQAAVHLWYEAQFGQPLEPLCSIADAVATWPETATALAVRLEPDGDLRVLAPCGLDDLLGMLLRRNRRQVSEQQFEHRLREKRIAEIWPLVKIIHD
jgi:hypothetical protein